METITASWGGLAVSHEHVSATTTVLTVVGEADVYTSPTLRVALVNVIEQGHVQLVVDLTDCESMDSTGLGVLVGALKRTRALGGTLVCVKGEPSLMKMFRITGLTRVFAFHDSVAQAEASLPLRAAGIDVASTPGPAAAVRPVDGPSAPQHPEFCPGLELSEEEPAEQDGHSALLAVSGCLCRNTAAGLRERIRDLAERGSTRLLVDLNGLGHLDGPGLGVLVGGLKLLRSKDGTLALAVAEPRILKVLRLTGLVKIFDIHGAAPEAPRPPARAA
ncbi:hypothetical protein KCH_19550 [Kitasatospora cheerisanensis KCTC 2395]|uniref:Anti-sigma factor antagonist n=1 Tax=Kitasatospora cheerisanensis KCTC 2395 TaxID=1348663 RepID=A0A066YX73_9ACTN|nr:hypothetical protein KCH_19550 [Kitasatospora cheerisanensis KCTC 2395]